MSCVAIITRYQDLTYDIGGAFLQQGYLGTPYRGGYVLRTFTFQRSVNADINSSYSPHPILLHYTRKLESSIATNILYIHYHFREDISRTPPLIYTMTLHSSPTSHTTSHLLPLSSITPKQISPGVQDYKYGVTETTAETFQVLNPRLRSSRSATNS